MRAFGASRPSDAGLGYSLEATGVYHLPILMYLKEHDFFVSVVNPYEMKKYRSQGLRCVKTDKQDVFARGMP